MDLKKLLGLRPKGGTAEELQAALGRARVAGSASQERVAELEARRADVLLSEDAVAVMAAEEALRTARGDVERSEVLVRALEDRLATARRVEERERIQALVAGVNARAEAAAEAIKARYPELAAAMVREVLHVERDADNALLEAWRELNRAYEAGVISHEELNGPLKLGPKVSSRLRPTLHSVIVELSAQVKLPGLADYEEHAYIWPRPVQRS